MHPAYLTMIRAIFMPYTSQHICIGGCHFRLFRTLMGTFVPSSNRISDPSKHRIRFILTAYPWCVCVNPYGDSSFKTSDRLATI